jgi:hypothetical protein
MQFDDRRRRDWRFRHAIFIDPFLNGDMCLGLKLEVSLSRIGAVVALHRAFDVDRMGVMPLDEIAVVAVHRPHEIG